jgi:hypothetical protein
MKNILFAITALTVISLSSCYVRVRENRPPPRPRGVIILSGDNAAPKDSLQSTAAKKDSLQPPVVSEPVK